MRQSNQQMLRLRKSSQQQALGRKVSKTILSSLPALQNPKALPSSQERHVLQAHIPPHRHWEENPWWCLF